MPTARLCHYLIKIADFLQRAGVESPRLCAQVLLESVLHLDRLECVLQAERVLLPEEIATLDVLAARCATGEPLAYLTGQREFYGRSFRVTPHTLIPRPETELLVDTALELLPSEHCVRFVDLGTGTGCIGVTLAAENCRWRGILLDINTDALHTARQNACIHGVADRTACVLADMHSVPLTEGSCQLAISNPPYIAQSETDSVMPEVLAFEPHLALFSNTEGLAHLKAAAQAAAQVLECGGVVVLEHGARQGADVRNLLQGIGAFDHIATRKDLAGLERCTHARKNSPRNNDPHGPAAR